MYKIRGINLDDWYLFHIKVFYCFSIQGVVIEIDNALKSSAGCAEAYQLLGF